jgi:predicted transcriptional regulator
MRSFEPSIVAVLHQHLWSSGVRREADGPDGSRTPMGVNLPPDLQDRLTRAAGRRGVPVEVPGREAIERAVNEEWFTCEVEAGLAQIDSGRVVTHDAAGTRLSKKLTERNAGC